MAPVTGITNDTHSGASHAQIYPLTVSWLRGPAGSHGAKSKVWTGLLASGGTRGDSVFQPLEASRPLGSWPSPFHSQHLSDSDAPSCLLLLRARESAARPEGLSAFPP